MNGAMREICGMAPVIPVIVIADLDDAVPLGRALVAGGLPVLEVALRTPVALDAIRAMSRKIPHAIVGAGSVVRPDQVRSIKAAGGAFAVSPGATPLLVETAAKADLPLLPGAATASEVMRLLEWGFETIKFFPAESSGGAGFLQAIAGPLPNALFCPTGGISLDKAGAYLALPNVTCVGGSWMLPQDVLLRKQWSEVETRAREASALKSSGWPP